MDMGRVGESGDWNAQPEKKARPMPYGRWSANGDLKPRKIEEPGRAAKERKPKRQGSAAGRAGSVRNADGRNHGRGVRIYTPSTALRDAAPMLRSGVRAAIGLSLTL